MRKRTYVTSAVVFIIAVSYVFNASWRVSPPRGVQAKLIAHRGVHQTFDKKDIKNDTCTAQRIHPPVHGYIENTLPSMRAAFAAGADVVELDVHPTTDGRLAVLHDWALECRTNGAGVTRSRDLAYLKSLDVGYGYTADGGPSFPLRGKGIGMTPELEEVLTEFPKERFLVNFKSHEAREGDMLAAVMSKNPERRTQIWGAYGGDEPSFRAGSLINGLTVWSARSLKSCLSQYIALGWMGYMPQPCRNTAIMIPQNIAPWLWGWPNLLQKRFHEAGSEIILLGPYEAGDFGTSGIDTLEQLTQIPNEFSGYIWTNRIELIGPAFKSRKLMADQ